MMNMYVHVIINLFKPTEYTAPRMNPNKLQTLSDQGDPMWGSPSVVTNIPTLVEDVDNGLGGGAVLSYMLARIIWEISILSFQFYYEFKSVIKK